MKVMKKTLAVLLSALMILSVNTGIIFAGGETTYPVGEEVTIQVSHSTDPSYYVTSSNSTVWDNSDKSIKNLLAVYRIPLPTVGEYQEISNFKFKYSIRGIYASSHTLYNLPGDWNLPEMKLADIDSAKADKANTVSSANITNVKNEAYTTTADPVYNFTADITSYAKKAYENKESYIYMALQSGSSINAFGTTVYTKETGMGLYPMYSFTLGAYSETMESATLTNGKAYHITTGSDPRHFAMDILPSAQYSANNFVLFALPVPSIEKGSEIFSYKLNVYVDRSDAMYALKFHGENWNLVSDAENNITGMRFGDENVSPIISDWVANKGASQYNAANSITYASKRAIVDLTSYMNECIKRGQKTCYVAMICEYSCGFYGFRPGKDEGAKINYTTKYACAPIGVKIAGADAKGKIYDSFENVTELSLGASYKAVGGFINKSLTDGKATLIIAKYNDADKLLEVEYAKDLVMSARNANGYIESEAVTVDGECAVVKAFIWANGEIVPLCESAVAELN